ncbi:MAG: hypothetical protein M1511_07295 [Deltaproteobacteria bacterium]|nr:hypothetical protein [Deltaproteobacteria bacterium]
MGKKVLAAVDANSITDSPVMYGIQLASRIQGAVIVIVVSSPTSGTTDSANKSRPNEIDYNLDDWFEKLVAQGQQNGVAIEIFLASGNFFDEISRFTAFNPSVQFIVMAAPERFTSMDGTSYAEDLKSLRDKFEGEILLVQKAGHVTRVPDLDSINPSREI